MRTFIVATGGKMQLFERAYSFNKGPVSKSGLQRGLYEDGDLQCFELSLAGEAVDFFF